VNFLHERDVATDVRLAALMRDFAPSKLDSNNRRLLEKLAKQKQAP
jgi:hypothetical protein